MKNRLPHLAAALDDYRRLRLVRRYDMVVLIAFANGAGARLDAYGRRCESKQLTGSVPKHM